MTKVNDLRGKTFGRLTVLCRATNTGRGRARWECSCTCGTFKTVVGTDLTNGHTKSCGCWRKDMPAEKFRTHGLRQSDEYRIWSHMKSRCSNPNTPYFDRYGGRGITVCERWQDFENFYRDMGPRPGPEYSIERLDNDQGYDPFNCVWSLPADQARNRSTVRLFTHSGITDTMTGWAQRTGIPYLKLRRRLADGWTFERAIGAEELKDRKPAGVASQDLGEPREVGGHDIDRDGPVPFAG